MTTVSRGYGGRHQRMRRWWKPKVHALEVTCWRCGHLIVPDLSVRGEGWDLGHNDERTGYNGPEHVDCNRSKGRRLHTPTRRLVL